MFNLFKRQQESNDIIVAEMHKEFRTASDNLLKDAKDIINFKHTNIRTKTYGVVTAIEEEYYGEGSIKRKQSRLYQKYFSQYRIIEQINSDYLEKLVGVSKSHISVRYNSYQDNLLICAPVKDMKESIIPIVQKSPPDPVVLACVDNGYLIVTAWGEEASDPIILNEKMN